MRFACLLLAALAAPLVSAQTLTGRVVDAVTQATLPGANVAVLGDGDALLGGAAADVDGAFAIDEETGIILFRDTLRLDTLDLAELDGSITALELALAENAGELLEYARQ